MSVAEIKVRAVVFDFDGVILESADIKTQAFLELFAEHPEHQAAILRHHLDNTGISRFKKFEHIYTKVLQLPYTETEQRRLGERFSELVLGKVLSCDFVPGSLGLLRALRGRCRNFVASGTPMDELVRIIGQREISEYFVEVWGSPHTKPEILRGILSRHNLRAEEVVMIGDGMSDYEATQEVGIPFIARGTPDLAEKWIQLGIPQHPDLHGVGELLGFVSSTSPIEF